MKVVPLGANVVVKPIDREAKTAGGIALPDMALQKPQEGRVLSVGDGHLLPDGTRAQRQVSEGDRILFNRFAGMEVQVDNQELLIMSEDDILAVVC